MPPNPKVESSLPRAYQRTRHSTEATCFVASLYGAFTVVYFRIISSIHFKTRPIRSCLVLPMQRLEALVAV